MFITFEGPDGSGKSTILNLVWEDLKNRGMDILKTREPGGPEISEKIRDLLLDPDNKEVSPRAEALLYAAARAQHVDQWIRPALKKGKIVLSDRFILSSIAYQGYGRGLGSKEIKEINDFAIQEIQPDLVLFFDIDPLLSIKRKRENFKPDRLEQEMDSFHQKVFDGYQNILRQYEKDDTFVPVDASGTVEEVFERVMKILNLRIGGRK
ncbi:MAG: dTMP kinase [Gallicola sp.]|nr:dTMP kinase [Gallicola sp.]